MARLSPMTEADRWMREGIEQINTGRTRFQQVKICAMNAGLAFIKARESVAGGDFNEFLEMYVAQIGRSTVYRNIEFVQSCLEWAALEAPALKDDSKRLFEHACRVVLQSPKPLIALLRQLGEMRKFGEYDSVKYARRQLLGGQQLELEFSKMFGWVESLSHIDQALLSLPEGKTESEGLAELEAGLETALEKVRLRISTQGSGGILTEGNEGNEGGGTEIADSQEPIAEAATVEISAGGNGEILTEGNEGNEAGSPFRGLLAEDRVREMHDMTVAQLRQVLAMKTVQKAVSEWAGYRLAKLLQRYRVDDGRQADGSRFLRVKQAPNWTTVAKLPDRASCIQYLAAHGCDAEGNLVNDP